MTLHHVTHDGRHVTDQDIARSAASALHDIHGESGEALMLWHELNIEASNITPAIWRIACDEYADAIVDAWIEVGRLHRGCRHEECWERWREVNAIRRWPMPSREDRMDVAAIAAE